MSKILGMSFDAAASPQITLRYTRADRLGKARPYGWGVAWYAADDRAATVIKDPTATSDGGTARLLRDWTRFRSTAFVCHLRGAAARISQENTHPFVRSHAGRDWVLTHHGQLAAGFADELPLGSRPVFEPVGRTDTEHLLCWLLQRCREHEITRLVDLGWERLHEWLAEANRLGSLNLLLSDGTHLVAYQDRGGHAPLRWTRRLPPHRATTLVNDDLELELAGVRDQARTVVLVATDRLVGEVEVDSEAEAEANADAEPDWQPLAPGQLIAICRGAVVASVGGSADTPSVRAPDVGAADVAAGAPVAAPVAPAVSARPVDPPVGASPLAIQQQQAEKVDAGGADGAEPAAATAPTSPGSAIRVYDVLHATRYAYGTPVELSRHVLRLRPVQDRYQELLSFDLDIDPLTAQHEHEDVFGNFACRIEIEGQAEKMAFVARSRVRVHPVAAGELRAPHRRTSVPLSWMPWQRQMMLPYLLPMELPETQLHELFDYAMSFVERQDYDIIETLLDINRSIYRDYAYVQGITSVETTPFEVYTTRRGVCQDFANLLICLARLLNVPARYRVGYIYTGGNYENKLQSDASHAWVEVFLPWLGWKGLDPTNGCIVDGDHIRVACGRHYRDATPTSGTIYRGGGDERLEIEVRVTPVVDGAL